MLYNFIIENGVFTIVNIKAVKKGGERVLEVSLAKFFYK